MNTAPIEILRALLPTLSQADVTQFIQLRLNAPLKNQEDVSKLLAKVQPNRTLQATSAMDVKSNYWLANTNMIIDQRHIHTQTLIKRSSTRQPDNNYTSVLWSKQKTVQLQ